MPHNAEDVIGDIEDVKDDLHDNLETAGREGAQSISTTAKGYVEQDADWRGHLQKSIGVTTHDAYTRMTFRVETDAKTAPYAPFVEFGTGRRSLKTSEFAPSVMPPPIGGDTLPPSGYPYSAPSMGPGLVSSIIEWVETKPIEPRHEGMTDQALGFQIAATIAEEGTYAHPFLRPAWFDNELAIRANMITAVKKAFS